MCGCVFVGLWVSVCVFVGGGGGLNRKGGGNVQEGLLFYVSVELAGSIRGVPI